MKKVIKSILTLLLAASFIAMSVTPVMAAEASKTIDYVAFGDSVAAGVRGGNGAPGSELKSDYGYTDDIANKLKDASVLGSFNEDFAISGMTAEKLAGALNDPIYGPAAYQLVKNAEIVTLDIGANDLLEPLYNYVAALSDIQDADPIVISVILQQIMSNLYGPASLNLQHNIEVILQSILNANQNVKIYIMGYYNPLPALPNINLNAPVEYLNNYIIKAAIYNVTLSNPSASITYIDTMEAMAKNSDKNLVPTDIHPTEAGYRTIAKEFWSQIKLNLRKID